jgi:hypothetical protein
LRSTFFVYDFLDLPGRYAAPCVEQQEEDLPFALSAFRVHLEHSSAGNDCLVIFLHLLL